MNPKPLSSLNHFTVPVAIVSSGVDVCCERGDALSKATSAGTAVLAGFPTNLIEGP
jgi:hypothetical protein